MKRGTRRGDVKFAHGSFSAVVFVQSSTWSNKLNVFAKKVGVKFEVVTPHDKDTSIELANSEGLYATQTHTGRIPRCPELQCTTR